MEYGKILWQNLMNTGGSGSHSHALFSSSGLVDAKKRFDMGNVGQNVRKEADYDSI